MIDRRGFLRFLGMGVAASVAAPIIKPKKLWFFGASDMWQPKIVAVSGMTDLSEWVAVRTSLPSFATIAVNGGILPSHSTVTMVRRSELDQRQIT